MGDPRQCRARSLTEHEKLDQNVSDAEDAEHLYQLLEREIVPLWYDQDANRIPRRWVQRMKESIRIAGRQFTARRMLQNYVDRYYAPILRGDPFVDDPPLG